MKPWLTVLLAMVIVVAAIVLWGARPGPVFSLGGVTYARSCFYNTTRGNYSFWSVYFNITNRGASASAAVAISVDGTVASYKDYYVASGGTTGVHELVTDNAIPTEPGCPAHNVTVGILGFVF